MKTFCYKRNKTGSTQVSGCDKPQAIGLAIVTVRRKKAHRTGSASRLLVFAIISIVVVGLLGMSALNPSSQSVEVADRPTIRIYCAASVASPLAAVLESYNRDFATEVRITRIGGSGELAGQIQAEAIAGLKKNGADLFLSADELLIRQLLDSGTIRQSIPVGTQRPVVAICSSSLATIQTFEQMVNDPKIRFGVASQRAAIGRKAREVARQFGILEQLEERKMVDAENVMLLAQALASGSLDAAVIWNTTVLQLNQSNPDSPIRVAFPLDDQPGSDGTISIGVVRGSESHSEADRLSRYLTSSQVARATFESAGFRIE